jgi:hypothetical protein
MVGVWFVKPRFKVPMTLPEAILDETSIDTTFALTIRDAVPN